MSARGIALALAVSGLSLTGVALAEDPPAQGTPAAQGTPLVVRPSHTQEIGAPTPSLSLWTKIGLATLVAGGAAFAWKMRGGKTTKRDEKKRALDVIARRAIGVRSELLVVETNGQRFLLGVTAGSISRLAVLTTTEEADEELEAAAPPPHAALRSITRARDEIPPRIAQLGMFAVGDDEDDDDDEPAAPVAKSALRPARPTPRPQPIPAAPKSDPAALSTAAKRGGRPKPTSGIAPSRSAAEEQIRGLLRRRAENG